MSEEIERPDSAIAARGRSQRLLLALYESGQQNSDGLTERPKSEVFSLPVGVAFRSDAQRFLRTCRRERGPEALDDAQEFLETVLSTNAIAFGAEHARQGWTGGYYLTNAKRRLEEVLRRRMESGQTGAEDDLTRVRKISPLGAATSRHMDAIL